MTVAAGSSAPVGSKGGEPAGRKNRGEERGCAANPEQEHGTGKTKPSTPTTYAAIGNADFRLWASFTATTSVRKGHPRRLTQTLSKSGTALGLGHTAPEKPPTRLSTVATHKTQPRTFWGLFHSIINNDRRVMASDVNFFPRRFVRFLYQTFLLAGARISRSTSNCPTYLARPRIIPSAHCCLLLT